jgi:hypothetical protein
MDMFGYKDIYSNCKIKRNMLRIFESGREEVAGDQRQ